MAKRADTKPRECAFCGEKKTPAQTYRVMTNEDAGKIECIACHDEHVQEVGDGKCDDAPTGIEDCLDELTNDRDVLTTVAILDTLPTYGVLPLDKVSVTLPKAHWNIVMAAIRLAERELDEYDAASYLISGIGRVIDRQL